MLALPDAETTDDMLKSSEYISVTGKRITIRKIDPLKICERRKTTKLMKTPYLVLITHQAYRISCDQETIHRALKIHVL